jgi:hypothetical protein
VWLSAAWCIAHRAGVIRAGYKTSNIPAPELRGSSRALQALRPDGWWAHRDRQRCLHRDARAHVRAGTRGSFFTFARASLIPLADVAATGVVAAGQPRELSILAGADVDLARWRGSRHVWDRITGCSMYATATVPSAARWDAPNAISASPVCSA